MNSSVVDKRVAILATDGFEQSELESPLEALKGAGARPKIVSLKAGKIQGTVQGEKGDRFDVDLTLDQANPDDFDALVLPRNPRRCGLRPKFCASRQTDRRDLSWTLALGRGRRCAWPKAHLLAGY